MRGASRCYAWPRESYELSPCCQTDRRQMDLFWADRHPTKLGRYTEPAFFSLGKHVMEFAQQRTFDVYGSKSC